MIYLATFGKFRYDPETGAGDSNYKKFEQVVKLSNYVLTKRKGFDIYPIPANNFGDTFKNWKVVGDLFSMTPIFFKYLYKAYVEKEGLILDQFYLDGIDQPIYFFSEVRPPQGQPLLMFESASRELIKEIIDESSKQKDNLPNTVD